MALPTTGLTFHADASVDTDLWTVNVAGVMSVHPADGEEVDYMDDVEHGAIVASKNGAGPVWRSGTPLMLLPCVDFNGSTQYYSMTANNPATPKVLSDFISASAFTVLVSVYVEGVATSAPEGYSNDGLMSDEDGFWGIHFKNDPKVMFFNWDGNEDTISLAISLNTSYVLMFRHEGGNIYASINGGSETSIASGNTSDLTKQFVIGKNGADKFFNGRMGEVAIWNAALTGTDLTDAMSYFTTKWITGPGGFVAFPHPRGESAGMHKLTGGINQ